MRKIKEALGLKFEVGLGLRQIARSCSIGLGTAHEYLQRAEAAKIRVAAGARMGVACALAQKACRDDYSAIYTRAQSLFRDLAMARAMGVCAVFCPESAASMSW